VILLIDNYDSFVHNLARYFMRLGQTTHVVRNDAVDLAGIRQLRPAAIVLSPGPCTPKEAGCSVDVIQAFGAELPTLGVCLGHQAIGVAYGGRVVRAERPMHGRTSLVRHRRSGLFRDIPSPLTACRYHSLVLDRASLPTCLDVTAWTDDGTVMGIAHREWPVFGVQFHPESILTEAGSELLANFLRKVRKG
jgi:anthranilate synthase/aminodeoxychorismate synthase-like glutamine amidotransferase